MDISIFLAKVLGLYIVIESIGMLLNTQRLRSIADQIVNNGALLLIAGTLSLITGIIFVVVHNLWEPDWRILITIIGWIALIKGIIEVVFPQVSQKLLTKFMANDSTIYVSGGVYLLIGIYLCYMGFLANPVV